MSKFQLHLTTTTSRKHTWLTEELHELSDENVAVAEICNCIAASDTGVFVVDLPEWGTLPVQIYPDLAILLEDMPDILHRLTHNENFVVTFPEISPGMEVLFLHSADGYAIHTTKGFHIWNAKIIRECFRALPTSFTQAASQCSICRDLPGYHQWMRAIEAAQE